MGDLYYYSTDFNILLDGHSHTTYSDGSLSPSLLLDWHIANGYNAAIITDHNTPEGAIEVKFILPNLLPKNYFY